jgi:hypothetical protein
MSCAICDDDEDVEPVTVDLPLDAETCEWLQGLSRQSGASIGWMIASMLRHIRIDDEEAGLRVH